MRKVVIRKIYYLIVVLGFGLGLALSSCDRNISGLSLDDLNDREELTGTLVINGSSYMNQEVQRILINGMEYQADESITLSESGFYRIQIFRKGGDANIPDIIRLVIFDKERGEAEWGVRKWTPVGASPGQIDNRAVSLIYPAVYPVGVNIPLIVEAVGETDPFSEHYQASIGTLNFLIKQGIGSIQIPSDGFNERDLSINQRHFPLEISTFDSSPLLLQGQLSADLHIPAGSFVRIEEDLIIPPDLTLVIDSGVFITINRGINIFNEGSLKISGTAAAPVTFTCTEPGEAWGGIIGKTPGNHIQASYTIFCQSGQHSGGEYDYGHAHRQALIYSESGVLDFDHCYFIDHAGQVFYPVSASLKITNCLIQRAITGGQINDSELFISHTTFTDFPDDTQDYQDKDNDALYLMGSNATINNSLFMYAKDDGLDSGGSGGGTIEVRNTHFMSIFHEGAALSSGGSVSKSHIFVNCTFTNCGQGLELGYSSPNHLVLVDSCLFQENGIGIRYGDNYISQHQGSIEVLNSLSISNSSHDIWNMLRENWNADTLKMEFNNVMVSMETPQYPQLELYESN